jgi:hypothetical protein
MAASGRAEVLKDGERLAELAGIGCEPPPQDKRSVV